MRFIYLSMLVMLSATSIQTMAQDGKIGASQRSASTLLLRTGESPTAAQQAVSSLRVPLQQASPANSGLQNFSFSKAPSRAEGESTWPDIYCQVQFSNDDLPGIYKLAEDGGLTGVTPASDPSTSFQGVAHRNRFYSFFMGDFPTVSVWDINTWERLDERLNGWDDPSNVCVSGASDGNCIYGAFFYGANFGYAFCKMDPETLETTKIRDLSNKWNGCAFDASGQLWAFDEAFNLIKVDKNTGEYEIVGNTGISSFLACAAVIDPATNKLYWNVCPSGASLLFEVDKNTAEIFYVHDHAGAAVITSLFIPENIEAGAPAAVEGLCASFEGASLSGIVSFTIPTLTYGGVELVGEVDYAVSFNGEQKGAGSAQPGATVDVPVTLEAEGLYQVSVHLTNETGKGPDSNITAYVGNDAPVAPKVTATYADESFAVSWTAVTEAANGGYVDPSKIVYDVTLMPNATKVAKGISSTSTTYSMAAPDEYRTYWFEVTAFHSGHASTSGASEKIGVGNMPLPYTEEFLDETVGERFVIVDANEDNITWYQQVDDHRMVCNYNGSMAMDDWLISPAVKLEKNHLYFIGLDACAQNANYPERVEAMIGNSADAASMTAEVIQPTVVRGDRYTHLEGSFTATETGSFFVGIHGISDADQGTLAVDNLSVSKGYHVKAPNAVTNLTVAPDAEGALKATISLCAPDLTVDSSTLGSLGKIEVVRDGELIHTFDNPAPGAQLECVDMQASGGSHVYGVCAYNENGGGFTTEASVFVGDHTPAAVTGLHLVQSKTNNSEVIFSWDAVDTDNEGNPLNPARVSYRVYAINGEGPQLLAEDVTDTEFSFIAYDHGTAAWAQTAIVAVTNGGESEMVMSELASVGLPQQYPWSESAPNCRPMNGFANDGSSWYLINDDVFQGQITAQDGDNGFYGVQMPGVGENSKLFTHMIDLTNAVNPTIGFATYNLAGNSMNTVEVLVRECGEKEWVVLKGNTCDSWAAHNADWGHRYVPINEYAGKKIQVAFRATSITYQWTFIDNVTVDEGRLDNITLHSLQAQVAKVIPGEQFNVRLYIENSGNTDIEGASVELSNDADIASVRIDDINLMAGEEREIDFTVESSRATPDIANFIAALHWDNDTFDDDNTVGPATVRFQGNSLPIPENFAVEGSEDGFALLFWKEPLVTTEYVESFEDYAPWDYANGPSRWTCVDGDYLVSGGVSEADFPGFTLGETRTSFWVLDSYGMDSRFKAHSGSQLLASIFPYYNGQNNDWAISPELSGEAQTITFYAHSFHEEYVETLRLLYSVSDTDPSNFIEVETVYLEGTTWQQFSFDVPEGAKYFAFNNVSNDQFMTMIDDVTFIPATKVQLQGYNVYRDGVKINEAPLSASTFEDSAATAGSHLYTVTALYNYGESRPAAPRNWTAVESIGIEHGAQWIRVEDREIVISGIESGSGIMVANPSGVVVYSAIADGGVCRIAAQKGIYLVKAGNKSAKIIVM